MDKESIIRVLYGEIQLVQKSIRGISAKKSDVQKSYADKMRLVDVEIKQLLARAGILNEHQELLSKKNSFRQEMKDVLSKLDENIDLQNNLINYFTLRIETLAEETENSE